jgi:hypothetical protein
LSPAVLGAAFSGKVPQNPSFTESAAIIGLVLLPDPLLLQPVQTPHANAPIANAQTVCCFQIRFTIKVLRAS